MTESGPRVIVALDFPEPGAALELADRLEPGRCRLKVGKELFTRGGPQMVGDLRERGYDIFLDLKFHDIPNTVARACAAAADLGVWMVNVHALGGRRMMEAAADAVAKVPQPPLLLAVTILTSLGDADLAEVGIQGSAEENVRRLAGLAEASGVGGVVCSPREVSTLRGERGEGFRLATPGIRPRWAAKDDQVRVTTPSEAVAAGADYLVIGRPITGAEDPLAALTGIEAELV